MGDNRTMMWDDLFPAVAEFVGMDEGDIIMVEMNAELSGLIVEVNRIPRILPYYVSWEKYGEMLLGVLDINPDRVHALKVSASRESVVQISVDYYPTVNMIDGIVPKKIDDEQS